MNIDIVWLAWEILKMFSLPINPKIDENFANDILIPFLKKHKEYIFDLYFTCRMPPFIQDAMGDVFEDDLRQTTFNALYISKQTGIPLSATFNNPYVRPTQENLDLFINNFKYIYEAGVRTVTLPHTSWMLTGQIQKEMPELYVKNTILHEVTKANDIVSLAKAGFNYINLDRDLMRDQDQLRRLKEAKDYCASIDKPVKFSMLANEGCWGGCPIMPEHYHYNNTRENHEPPYFGNIISRVSCSKWEQQDSSAVLKSSNLPPWKKDWEEMFDLGIDVFKLHGRESVMRLKESMDIIHRWANDEELLFPELNTYIQDKSLNERPIDIWREKIKTCKFDCWDCNYCEAVIDAHHKKQDRVVNPLVTLTLDAIDRSGTGDTKFDPQGFNIEGLSSDRVRHFLNHLCSDSNNAYLEIGCYTGSTYFAAIMGNNVVSYAVDNFAAPISPARDDIEWIGCKDPKAELFRNNIFFGSLKSVILDIDVKKLNSSHFSKKPNIVFYDGEHNEQQIECLNNLLPNIQDTFILVLDDANFDGVIRNATKFIDINNLRILFERQILTPQIEDSSSWWNGLSIYVLTKKEI